MRDWRAQPDGPHVPREEHWPVQRCFPGGADQACAEGAEGEHAPRIRSSPSTIRRLESPVWRRTSKLYEGQDMAEYLDAGLDAEQAQPAAADDGMDT